MSTRLVTIVETDEFQRLAPAIFTADEAEALITHLAHQPAAGAVIPGSGGVRKLRWGAKGKGKRGGARVIYYFHDAAMPLFLLTAYAKSAKTDLTAAERKVLQSVTTMIADRYAKKGRR